MPDSFDFAYAAGILDGEGWIGMSTCPPKGRKRSPVFQCQVAVRMTDRQVPDWLAETFGGRVLELGVSSPRSKRPIFHWSLTGERAAEFCRLVRPHLRVKHRQAELVVRYREDARLNHNRRGGRGVRTPDAEVEIKKTYAAEFAALNGRAEP